MKFGEVSVGEAQGSVLAHSISIPGGRLKKGTVLDATHLSRLRESGLQRVVVARLEDGEVAEDEAASRLARVIAGPGVRVARPFTGRCNLFARQHGVCVIDEARVHAINRVHESVTLATVQRYQVASEGQMLATVKMIPFAVDGEHLDAAISAAGTHPAVTMRHFAVRRPVLIQTLLPGMKSSMLDKTRRVTEERLGGLGTRLVTELRCEHSVPALCSALMDALAADADLIMIVGGSAIVDRRDVIPCAIEACDGRVEHFGMPVDPGNLLLLGSCASSVVLGMPGCARSSSYNGLDQILCMLAAGHEVTPVDITTLGVGGLLKEMPGRPQPRRSVLPEPAAAPRIAALVLAAGQSRRMGRVNKLLVPLEGRSMLEHVLDAVEASQVQWSVVVTGHESERIQALLRGRGVSSVDNPDYANGLSTSLACGLSALPAEADAVLVCLGDMPRVSAADIDRLLRAFDPAVGRSICVPTFDGKRGNPVLWDRRYAERMREIRGDVGARHLIGEFEDEVVEVPMRGDAVLIDIDSPDALERLGASARDR